MLEAKKASFWRSSYDIVADGRAVATWNSSTWKSGGRFELDGRPYQVRGNVWGNRFELVDATGIQVASADRVGRRSWTVEAAGQTYHFRRATFWGSEQELHNGGDRVGSVRRTSPWTGSLAADLPGLPVPVQIFVLGVVITMWNDQGAAAAAAS